MHAALLALFAAAALQVSSAGDPAKMKEIMEKCSGQNAISPDEMEALKSLTIPSSDAGKCFVGCLFEEVGMLTGGSFNRATTEALARAKLQEKPEELDKYMQLIEKCSDEVASHDNKCETGPKLMECIKNYAPGLGIVLAGSA
ncbi:hypothetical protein R5R35_011651 [Gryllus longicercus]|uniref:Odorant binding protein n=1 Tax=Gryllus longicercus TaxID=2509291 RepID=A0AAN9VA16_9ORTH